MSNLVLKIELAQVALFFAALMPLYGLIMQIIKHERQAALDRQNISDRIEFIEKRLDNIDNLVAANSKFRLK
jgi:sensor domain CHASE-containing protein